MTATRAKTRAERQAELVRMVTQPVDVSDRGQVTPREPTAAERLVALAQRRRANGGYLIPRPLWLTPDAFRTWLYAIAEEGAPGDLEIAWHYYADASIKERLRNEYIGLLAQAGQRYHALEQAAWLERQQEIAEAAPRIERDRLEREIAEHEAAIAALRQQLARLKG